MGGLNFSFPPKMLNFPLACVFHEKLIRNLRMMKYNFENYPGLYLIVSVHYIESFNQLYS